MSRSLRAKSSGLERRAYPVALQVTRAQSTAGPVTVEGYASVVDSPYEMFDSYGPYSEVVRSGSFKRTLNANPAVQLLLNHGGLSMAYTKAGTLALSEDSTGLHMRADVNPARSDVRDMLTALEDGAVDEMSFAFRVTRQEWSPDFDQRDIQEVDLHRGDVSVVNFGANPGTSVGSLRAEDVDRMSPDAARALMARLQARIDVPGRAHAVMSALREGRAVAPADVALVASALAQFAAIDLIVDDAQEKLSAALGVPNPDDDEMEPGMEQDAAGIPLELARAQALALSLR